MDRYDHSSWGWGWLGMVVFMAVIAVTVVWIVRAFGAAASRPSADEAERILEARFARGELDAEEFTVQRDLLRKR